MNTQNPHETSLGDFVTKNVSFTLAADTERVGGGQKKIGIVSIAGEAAADTNSHNSYTFVSDEPRLLEGEETAPLPLQYFLAGIAF